MAEDESNARNDLKATNLISVKEDIKQPCRTTKSSLKIFITFIQEKVNQSDSNVVKLSDKTSVLKAHKEILLPFYTITIKDFISLFSYKVWSTW